MKTRLDLIYQDLKKKFELKVIVFSDDPVENFRIVDKELNTVNLAKCSLRDLEIEYPAAGAYIGYMFQTEKGVNFGVCPKLKLWNNHQGWQNRCLHNDKTYVTQCFGQYRSCQYPKHRPEN